MFGYERVVEHEVPQRRRSQAHLCHRRSALDTGRVGLDQEDADPAQSAALPGRCKADHEIRGRAVGDIGLSPRQRPAAIDWGSPRSHRKCIRSGVRLGDRKRPDRGARGEPGQIALLLFLGAVGHEAGDEHPGLDRAREHQAAILTSLAQSFRHQQPGQRVDVPAPELRRRAEPEISPVREALPLFGRKAAGAIVFDDSGVQGLSEFDRLAAERQAVLRPVEIHQVRGSVGASVSTRLC
jgi:hypothetical protein